jgi:hypothetical protein
VIEYSATEALPVFVAVEVMSEMLDIGVDITVSLGVAAWAATIAMKRERERYVSDVAAMILEI